MTRLSKAALAALRQRQKKNPLRMTELPPDQWRHIPGPKPERVWISSRFMVQGYREHSPILIRLTVNSTDLNRKGEYLDGLTWDDLQRIKLECGFGDYDAVEIFPRESNIVNVANMRHLWVYKSQIDIGWSK